MTTPLPRFIGQTMEDGSVVAPQHAKKQNQMQDQESQRSRYLTPEATPAPDEWNNRAVNPGRAQPTGYQSPQLPKPVIYNIPELNIDDSPSARAKQRPVSPSVSMQSTVPPLSVAQDQSTLPSLPSQTSPTHMQVGTPALTTQTSRTQATQIQTPASNVPTVGVETNRALTRFGKARAPQPTRSQEEITRVLNVPGVLEKQNGIFMKVPDPFEVLQISRIDKDGEDVDPALVNSAHKKEQYKKMSRLVHPDNQADDWKEMAGKAMELVNNAKDYFKSKDILGLDEQEEFYSGYDPAKKIAEYEKNPTDAQKDRWLGLEINMSQLKEVRHPFKSDWYQNLQKWNERVGAENLKKGRNEISGQVDFKFFAGCYQQAQDIRADLTLPEEQRRIRDPGNEANKPHAQMLRDITEKTEAKVNEYQYPRSWIWDWDDSDEYGGHYPHGLSPDDMDLRLEPGEGANESGGLHTAEPQMPLSDSIFLPDTTPLPGSAEEIPMMPIFQEGFTDDGLQIFAWRKSGAHSHQFLVQDGTRENPHYSLKNSSLCGGWPVVSRNTEGGPVPRLGEGDDEIVQQEKRKSTFNGIWAVAEETFKTASPKRKPVTFCLATFDSRPPCWMSRTNLGLVFRSKIAADRAIDICKRRPAAWLERSPRGDLSVIPATSQNNIGAKVRQPGPQMVAPMKKDPGGPSDIRTVPIAASNYKGAAPVPQVQVKIEEEDKMNETY